MLQYSYVTILRLLLGGSRGLMESVGVGGHKRRADVVTAGSSVGGSVMGEVIRNCQLHVILLYHFEEEKFYMLW
jgi:hypothetical protein